MTGTDDSTGVDEQETVEQSSDASNQPASDGSRQVRIESTYGDEETAARIAGAIEPDNTPEIQTSVDGPTVVTDITRSTTGSLQATVDDYVVNLQVAAQLTNKHGDDRSSDTNTSNTDHE
jgi:hypothetical protein